MKITKRNWRSCTGSPATYFTYLSKMLSEEMSEIRHKSVTIGAATFNFLIDMGHADIVEHISTYFPETIEEGVNGKYVMFAGHELAKEEPIQLNLFDELL